MVTAAAPHPVVTVRVVILRHHAVQKVEIVRPVLIVEALLIEPLVLLVDCLVLLVEPLVTVPPDLCHAERLVERRQFLNVGRRRRLVYLLRRRRSVGEVGVRRRAGETARGLNGVRVRLALEARGGCGRGGLRYRFGILSLSQRMQNILKPTTFEFLIKIMRVYLK